MILTNREGHAEFNIPKDWHKHRGAGLSAMLRIHNEEAWIGPCIDSLLSWCAEIVVVLNCCTDDTASIVDEYGDRLRVFDYPFQIHPMGPGHDACPADSVHASAYFYNFTQAMTTRTQVMKWDGDMVAMDWLGGEVRALMARGAGRIKFAGIDIVGDDLTHIGNHPNCPTNGIYRVREGAFYGQGPMTQNLRGVTEPMVVIQKPAFLHFKWARKTGASATVQWPDGWERVDHFANIYERRHPVAPYEGEYPASVKAML